MPQMGLCEPLQVLKTPRGHWGGSEGHPGGHLLATTNKNSKMEQKKAQKHKRASKAGGRMLREMQWQQWNLPNQELILLVSLFVCATLKLCESRCSAGVKLQEKRLKFEKRGFVRGGS
jgi:hypothetical protein